ncbi:MAG: ATP-dependent Clp protease ATP-binding subunit, partial [Clostridia bacterium]|nr:ATP-dependent Clp protease ATP-binding subunit [Clostridia bacterium]
MKKVLCSRCKQRPAVIFISKIIDGKTVPEGLCLHCAMEMNIGPIRQMMDSMGITEEDIDLVSEQFSEMFPDTDDDGSFEAGGSPTMPFLQGLFGDMKNALTVKDDADKEPAKSAPASDAKKPGGRAARREKKNAEKKRKFLTLYCTDLTARARDGKLDNIIGRDKEIARVEQILCRRSKNNPCLIGEP